MARYNSIVNPVKPNKSRSRRKVRKAFFTATSAQKYKMMSSMLSKELRTKYNVRHLPIRKEDEVLVMRGSSKGRTGKVSQVYRLKNVIHIESIKREKTNGQQVPIPIHASNLQITKLKLDNSRRKILDRKGKGKSDKGKYSTADAAMES